jgi:nitrogen fixation-related uncharacterized protein
MCPNCVLNQASLSSGMYVAFGVCGVFFVVGILAMLWAFKNGEFENMEDSKFDMLDDGENDALSMQTRKVVEQARERKRALDGM